MCVAGIDQCALLVAVFVELCPHINACGVAAGRDRQAPARALRNESQKIHYHTVSIGCSWSGTCWRVDTGRSAPSLWLITTLAPLGRLI